ncbi:MAG: PRD domain-containing protein [Enterococcus sp.]
MEVYKGINNNFALARIDEEEVVVAQKGIGFGKFPKFLDEDSAEKIYHLSESSERAFDFTLVSPEIFNYTHEIIKEVEKSLDISVSDLLFLTIADHTNYMLKRLEQDISLSGPFQLEIKKFFPKEYNLGLWIIDYLAFETKLIIPPQEASAYSLHLINAQANFDETRKVDPYIRIIQSIIKIVKYHFQKEFDEESFSYLRFVTHLKFFIGRKLNGELQKYRKSDIYKNLAQQFPEEAACVLKISNYLKQTYDWELDEEDLLYLLLHIKKITEN